MHRWNLHGSWIEEKVEKARRTALLSELNKGPQYTTHVNEVISTQQVSGSRGLNRHSSWADKSIFETEDIGKKNGFNFCVEHKKENCKD